MFPKDYTPEQKEAYLIGAFTVIWIWFLSWLTFS